MSGTTLVPVVGTVTITGTGPAWSLTETLAVGDGAAGLLDINSGGIVTDSAGVAAGTDGGSGTISVTGGTLTNDGGTTYIGEDGGSTGLLLVSGSSSALDGNSALIFGENGAGAGTITGGSTVSLTGSAYVSFGHQTSGVGSLLVQDALLNLTDNTYGIGLGKFGQGVLDVEAGGTVETSGDGSLNSGGINIGESAGAAGLLRVNGAGALVDEAAYLLVGYSGSGTLEVTGGTVALTGTAYLSVGVNGGSSGSVLVSSGGMIDFGTATGGIGLGHGGAGTLDIESGGTVAVDDTAGIGVGQSAAAIGQLIVNGTGALLEDEGPLIIGSSGSGTLDVTNSGTVEITGTGYLQVGGSAGGTGSILVSGGGILNLGTATQGIAVGRFGHGTLDVESGGTVELGDSAGFGVGQSLGATGLVEVNGTGALVSSVSGFNVGDSGTGTISVENGGTLQLVGKSGMALGVYQGGAALIVVSGADSLLNLGSTASGISVGEAGAATIEVENNGTMRLDGTSGIGLAFTLGSTGLIVVNQGVLLEDAPNATGMGIGEAGTGTLLVETGGTVELEGTTTSSGISIGKQATGTGLIKVSGAGARLDLETPQSGINIGQAGTGTLDIEAGGTVFLNDPISGGIGVGFGAGASGTLSLSGAGSLLQITGTIPGVGTISGNSLAIGNAGTGMLSVRDGAEIDLGGGLQFSNGSASNGTGIVDNATINAGWLADGGFGVGTLTIQDGAQVNFSGIHTSNVGEGTTGSGTLVVNGGTLTQTAGTFDVGVTGIGIVDIGAGGLIDLSTLVIGGTGVVSDVLGTLSASDILLAQGGLISGTGLLVASTIADAGTIAASGGTLAIQGEISGTGMLVIDQSSVLMIDGTADSGATIDFSGDNGTLIVSQPSSLLGTLTSFAAGDTLEFTGLTANQAVYDTTTHTLDFYDIQSGQTISGQPLGTIALAGTYSPDEFSIASDTNNDAFVTVLCFCAGTLIQTPAGEKPVEQLIVGDTVMTRAGAERPIAWIGKGRVLATRGRRTAATPVIIRKSAFADNVPNQDLRVTKGHAFYFDGALVPIEFLVNHRSILWDDQAQEVELYHIELETHDVLLANGAAAESYRDDGNRWLFQNANTGWDQAPKAPCAPVLTGGPLVDAVWRRLLDRSGQRPGTPLTKDPDLHLMIDGRRLDPIKQQPSLSVFRLPGPPSIIRIVSRSAAPQELGLARDPRQLGVALRRIVFSQAMRQRLIEAADRRLADGYHAFEAGDQIRWTNGDAAIPVDLFRGADGPCFLTLHLGGSTQYRDDGRSRRAA